MVFQGPRNEDEDDGDEDHHRRGKPGKRAPSPRWKPPAREKQDHVDPKQPTGGTQVPWSSASSFTEDVTLPVVASSYAWDASPRAKDIQNRPATRQIQPIGFSGRFDAIRAPTIGKARKGTYVNSLPMGSAAGSPGTAQPGRGRTGRYPRRTWPRRGQPATTPTRQRPGGSFRRLVAQGLLVSFADPHHTRRQFTGRPSAERYEECYEAVR